MDKIGPITLPGVFGDAAPSPDPGAQADLPAADHVSSKHQAPNSSAVADLEPKTPNFVKDRPSQTTRYRSNFVAGNTFVVLTSTSQPGLTDYSASLRTGSQIIGLSLVAATSQGVGTADVASLAGALSVAASADGQDQATSLSTSVAYAMVIDKANDSGVSSTITITAQIINGDVTVDLSQSTSSYIYTIDNITTIYSKNEVSVAVYTPTVQVNFQGVTIVTELVDSNGNIVSGDGQTSYGLVVLDGGRQYEAVTMAEQTIPGAATGGDSIHGGGGSQSSSNSSDGSGTSQTSTSPQGQVTEPSGPIAGDNAPPDLTPPVPPEPPTLLPPPAIGFDPSVAARGATLVLSGSVTVAAGATLVSVDILEDGVTIGSATVQDGLWSYDFDQPPGFHTNLQAVVTDSQGLQSVASSDFDLTTGIQGEKYTSSEDRYDPASGTYLGSTFFKSNGVVLLQDSYTELKNGDQVFTYDSGSFFSNKSYSSYSDRYDQDGNLLTHTENKDDGSHTILVEADHLRVRAIGSDLFDDFAAGTRFVFGQGFGEETIRGFEVSGADHDTVSLPDSEAGHLARILAHASGDGQGDTVLHLGQGDTITFMGVSAAALRRHEGDFVFHP